MCHLLKALLIAGLFIFTVSAATTGFQPDFAAGGLSPKKSFSWTCEGTDSKGIKKQFSGKSAIECLDAWASYYNASFTEGVSNGQGGKYTIKVSVENCLTTGACQIKQVRTTVHPTYGTTVTNSTFTMGATKGPETLSCPPENPYAGDTEWEKHVIGPVSDPNVANGPELCWKPHAPIDCSDLQGLSVNNSDRYVTDKGVYSKSNPPSCSTKCAVDENGIKKCGDCKVVAKTWIMQPYGLSQESWQPMIGTFTGASCGQDEQKEPPEDKPTCWQTKNNLKMCQADPKDRCTSLNGIQQCDSGCGSINGDFWCAEPDPDKPPLDKEPIPDKKDEIKDPKKPINDMLKEDFKDVQVGVESRLDGTNARLHNIQGTLDSSYNQLDGVNQKLKKQLGDNQTMIGLLDGILSNTDRDGGGQCDPKTDEGCEDDGGVGNCDPSKKDCDDFTSGVPHSWWESKYPDGLGALFAEKQTKFYESAAYKAMTGDGISVGGSGNGTAWNLCFSFGFADYGCHLLEIPLGIWLFIKACILFTAAILCRRLLVGA